MLYFTHCTTELEEFSLKKQLHDLRLKLRRTMLYLEKVRSKHCRVVVGWTNPLKWSQLPTLVDFCGKWLGVHCCRYIIVSCVSILNIHEGEGEGRGRGERGKKGRGRTRYTEPPRGTEGGRLRAITWPRGFMREVEGERMGAIVLYRTALYVITSAMQVIMGWAWARTCRHCTQAGMHNMWMCGQMRPLAPCLAISHVAYSLYIRRYGL